MPWWVVRSELIFAAVGIGRARPSGCTVLATARRISAAVSFACSYVRLLANVLPAVAMGARPLMRVGELGVIGGLLARASDSGA